MALKNLKSSNEYIQIIKKLKKIEKIREQQTVNELRIKNNYSNKHKEDLNNYLKQIQINIYNLDYLYSKLNKKQK